jgi:pseudouridine synthase
MGRVRINKALADAGLGSRRKVEELIRAGRVQLNGQTVTELATRVAPGRDKLRVDGKPVKLSRVEATFMYYKPRGMISSLHDERGRPCLRELCDSLPGVVRPVGRLDRDSEGLLLLTTDGELAHKLMHPGFRVTKSYRVTIKPRFMDEHGEALAAGIILADGPARFLSIALTAEEQDRSRLEVVVDEGRNRLVRRMFEACGYEVRRLLRTQLGPLQLGNLRPGEHRQLNSAEVRELHRQTGRQPQAKPQAPDLG